MGEERDRREVQGSGLGPVFSVLIFGFGAAAGILLAFVGAGFVQDSGQIVVTVFLSALVIVGLLGLLLFLFRRPILRRLFGYAETQVELFADPLARVADGALQRDPRAATEAARDLVALGLARYSWLAARRWVIASLTALIAAMAALAGTALLFKQNALLEAQTDLLAQQNAKIDAQTDLLTQDVQLAEAARNAALAVEMTGIAAQIGAAAETAAQTLPDAEGAAGMVNLLDPFTDIDRSLLLRIVSISRAVRPYRFLDTGILPDDPNDRMRVAMEARRALLPQTWERMAGVYGWQASEEAPRLIDRPASPERGQLLQLLLSGGLRNLELLNHFGLDLSFALFRDSEVILATAQGARLSYADFSGTQVRGSDLGGAYLDNARFRRAVIVGSDFSAVGADRVRSPLTPAMTPITTAMAGVDFAGAYVEDTSFAGANMLAAGLDGAVLSGVSFAGASLGAASVKGAVLIGVDFAGSDLKSVDFDGTILFGDDPLGRLAAAAAPGRFTAARFRADPVGMAEVMAHPVVYLQLSEADITERTRGAPAFRLVRIAGFED